MASSRTYRCQNSAGLIIGDLVDKNYQQRVNKELRLSAFAQAQALAVIRREHVFVIRNTDDEVMYGTSRQLVLNALNR